MYGVRCMLPVCCLLFVVVCCSLTAVRCSLCGGCRMLFVAGRCLLCCVFCVWCVVSVCVVAKCCL